MKYIDLPTDPADIEQDTEEFFSTKLENLVSEGAEQGDDSSGTDVILILADLDPVEIVLTEPDENGVQAKAPRWTPLQQKIIMAARDQVDAWQ